MKIGSEVSELKYELKQTLHCCLTCQSFECDVNDLESDGEHAELGRGQYGSVYRMRHKPTNTMMAVEVLHALTFCPLHKS